MKTIHLYGQLGKEFGRKHRFDVKSPAEAVRALQANFPGFVNKIKELSDKGFGYRITAGTVKKRTAGVEKDEEVFLPMSGDIHIAPEIHGSKKGGLGQIIIGAVMMIAAFWTAGASMAAMGAAVKAGTIAGFAWSAGISMVLGGVAQLITGTTSQKAAKDAKDNGSYVFNGAVNTTAQGSPVPICYGEMIVGSAVISSGIDVDQIAYEGSVDGSRPDGAKGLTSLMSAGFSITLFWDTKKKTWMTSDGTYYDFDESIDDNGDVAHTNFRHPKTGSKPHQGNGMSREWVSDGDGAHSESKWMEYEWTRDSALHSGTGRMSWEPLNDDTNALVGSVFRIGTMSFVYNEALKRFESVIKNT